MFLNRICDTFVSNDSTLCPTTILFFRTAAYTQIPECVVVVFPTFGFNEMCPGNN